MKKSAWLEGGALLVILLLAAALRLGWPGVNSFAFDEARLSLIALEMARGGQFAYLGMPSSVGIPNLPAAAWIYAVPYFFSTNPLFATQFTGVLSLGAVFGVWLLARRAWGLWAGLIAALYLATSPYSVLYSRSVWAQNLLPPLALAWAWAAYLGAAKQNRIAVAAHVFLAGFAFQVHFAGAPLAPATLYFIARFRWWRRPAPMLAGAALVLLALLPSVNHIICCVPQVLDPLRSALGGPAQVSLTGFQDAARLIYGFDWRYLAAGQRRIAFQPDLSGLVGFSILVCLLAGFVMLLRSLRAPKEESGSARIVAEILIVWLIISPLFFVRHTTPVYIHYQLASLPAAAVMIGASAQLIRRRGWPLVILMLMILTAYQWSMEIRASLDAASAHATPGGLGTPLLIAQRAADSVPQDTPVLFFTHGDDPKADGEAAVFETLWWGRDHRIIDGRSLLILPPYRAYLMATLAPFQAWEEIEAAGLANDPMAINRREGEGPGFIAAEYDGHTEPPGFTALDPIRLANGVQLEGWKARSIGPRLRISTLWRVLETPPGGTFQQFHHLRTANSLEGDPLMISDVPISAHDWQIGDRLIVMGDFFVQEQNEFWVDVGHYTLPEIVRAPFADGSGDSIIRLGPFTIPEPSS